MNYIYDSVFVEHNLMSPIDIGQYCQHYTIQELKGSYVRCCTIAASLNKSGGGGCYGWCYSTSSHLIHTLNTGSTKYS